MRIQFVPQPIKPSPNYRDIVKKLLDGRYEDKQKIDDYLDHFQSTIDETREKQEQYLEKRYRSILQALERAKNNLVKYNISLLELQEKIEKSAEIRKVLEDVNNYRTYSEALTENINKLQSQVAVPQFKIEDHTKKCKNLKRVIEYKHTALNSQNSKNLVLLRQINAARHSQKKQKKTSETQRSHQLTTFYNQKPETTEQQIDPNNIKYENKQMRYQLTSYRNNKYLKTELFNECMESYKRYFSKSQKVVKNSGLQHSLLFEIQKAQFTMQDNQANNRYNVRNVKSMIAGRQIRNLVHDTLKTMAEVKQSSKNQTFDNLDLKWEVYKDFNAMQVVALICLKPKVFQELSVMFQQCVLH